MNSKGRDPKTKRSYREIRYFTEMELELIMLQLLRLRKSTDRDPDRAFFVWMMIAGGFRISELASLRIEDCYDNYVHVRAGKGGKPRDVELMPEAVWWYHEYAHAHRNKRYLFQSPPDGFQKEGRPIISIHRHMSVRHVDRWWNRVIASCGVRRLTSHEGGRKTYATWEAERLPVQSLMDQLGHEDFATTNQYYRGKMPGRRYYQAQPRWREIMASGGVSYQNVVKLPVRG